MRKLFKLVGEITIDGLVNVNKSLTTLDKQTNKISKEFNKLSRTVGNAGMSLTKNITAPVIAASIGIYKLIDASSDLVETTSKVGENFGESAKEIDKWSNSTANAIGQSKKEALHLPGR